MDAGTVELLRYNAWANATLLTACSELKPDQLEAGLASATGPIADLWMHTIGAQENYAHWVRGRDQRSMMERGARWPGIDELVARSEVTGRELVALASETAADSEVVLRHDGLAHRYPVRLLFCNVVEHGIRHRTEIALSLTSIGVSVPDLDGWAFGRAMGYGSA